MVDRTVEESIETAIKMTIRTGAGTGLEKGHFPEIMATMLETEVQAIIGPGQDQVQVQIGIEFYKCRKYNPFARDCPTSREE